MVDLVKLVQVAAGAELPPTVRDAVRALSSAPQIDLLAPPQGLIQLPVRAGVYALVEVTP